MDIKSYLTDKGIEYKESGENISSSSNWIGINCVFCGEQDNHLGVNLKSESFSCWKCNTIGSIINLIQEIDKCNFYQAKKIFEGYDNGFTSVSYKNIKKIKKRKDVKIPSGVKPLYSNSMPDIVKRYFNKRKLPYSLCEEFKLGFTKIGDYPLSIFIPVYLNNEFVSYQTLDISGKRKIKYISEPSIKNYIYNIDRAKTQKKVYLCEGVVDAWKIGDGAICGFSKNLSVEQIELLVDMLPGNTILNIVFDADALLTARKVFNKLVSYFSLIKVIQLSNKEKDPGNMSISQIHNLRNL